MGLRDVTKFARSAFSWRRVPALHQGALRYRPDNDDAIVRGRLAVAGLLLFLVFVIGTGGYAIIGGGQWSLQDCAYMVLITITSVGYGEVLPVAEQPGGRPFTMALLIGGMGVSFYFLSALTAFIIEGDLGEALWRRKMRSRLMKLEDHVIVCGAGRTGRQVAAELVSADATLVVVERDQDSLDAMVKKYGDRCIAIHGDATDDRVLTDAGVERARGLVTALQKDQDNLYVALSARSLNASLRIVARADAERAEPKLRQAGADVVVSPTHIGGRRMANELLRPNVVGFLDFLGRDFELDIEELEIGPKSPLAGVKLSSSRIREVSNALVLAVRHDGNSTYNPPPTFELRAGMMLIVIGEPEQIEGLQRYAAGT